MAELEEVQTQEEQENKQAAENGQNGGNDSQGQQGQQGSNEQDGSADQNASSGSSGGSSGQSQSSSSDRQNGNSDNSGSRNSDQNGDGQNNPSEPGKNGGNGGGSNGQRRSRHKPNPAKGEGRGSGMETTAPRGNTKPVSKTAVEEAIKQASQSLDSGNGTEDLQKELMEKLKKALAEKAADQECEAKLEEEQKQDSNEAMQHAKDDAASGESVLEVSPIRPETTPTDIEAYNKIYQLVAGRSKAAQRLIRSALKERKEEGWDDGYLTGGKFNPDAIRRNNGRYFSRKILPDGQPDVCFGVLIDQSGSMEDEKINAARRSVILLEDILRNLGTPHFITGHTTCYKGMAAYNYVDPKSPDKRDKYRLVHLNAEGGTTDACALTYMSERMLKRPEAAKVVIVISDGQPNTLGYDFGHLGRRKPKDDLIECIKHYRRKGIKVFALGVDASCVKAQSEIYGETFTFDCSDLSRLGPEMVKLIKRYVLKK